MRRYLRPLIAVGATLLVVSLLVLVVVRVVPRFPTAILAAAAPTPT